MACVRRGSNRVSVREWAGCVGSSRFRKEVRRVLSPPAPRGRRRARRQARRPHLSIGWPARCRTSPAAAPAPRPAAPPAQRADRWKPRTGSGWRRPRQPRRRQRSGSSGSAFVSERQSQCWVGAFDARRTDWRPLKSPCALPCITPIDRRTLGCGGRADSLLCSRTSGRPSAASSFASCVAQKRYLGLGRLHTVSRANTGQRPGTSTKPRPWQGARARRSIGRRRRRTRKVRAQMWVRDKSEWRLVTWRRVCAPWRGVGRATSACASLMGHGAPLVQWGVREATARAASWARTASRNFGGWGWLWRRLGAAYHPGGARSSAQGSPFGFTCTREGSRRSASPRAAPLEVCDCSGDCFK